MGMFMRRGVPPKVAVDIRKFRGVENDRAYVKINGVKYYGSQGGGNILELYRGTVVDVYVNALNSDLDGHNCYVQVGKRVVKKGAGTYQYTVLSPSKILFQVKNPASSDEYHYCIITRT